MPFVPLAKLRTPYNMLFIYIQKLLSDICQWYQWHANTSQLTRNLNDLRKNFCLRKSEVYVKKKKKKTVSNVIEKLVEHDIHCLPCSYTNDVINLSS